ncbi:MAG TPA: hypothetical protein VNO33_11170, partial [Kofleriaceae bacterium]|nr:hypothetical protein [Kofleriaceae bacterium]
MTADVVADRLDDLVRARVATASRPPSDAEVVRALRPLAPATHDDARWRAAVLESLARVRAGELSRAPSARFAIPTGEPWKRIVERIVPGLALGIAPGDTHA